MDVLQELINQLPEPTEVWTEEEGKMSTPYSDVEAWQRLLMYELVLVRSMFNGPPGLRDKMQALLDATGLDVMRERLLDGNVNIRGSGKPWLGRYIGWENDSLAQPGQRA